MEFINVKLSDIGEVVGGSTPSTKNSDNYDGNIAWITPKDLAGYNKVYISRGERNITEAGFKSCSTRMLPKNSVLFSSRAPIGYVAISENDLCTNQGFKSIIPNEKVDYKFLYYLLKHNKDYIASKGSGSTFKEVSGSVMKGIELSIPKDVNDQRKISKVLFDIDKKIELNNEINNNLSEQIKSIYNETFIDFIDYKRLDEISNVTIGKTPPRSEQECFTTNKNDVKWVSISDIGRSGMFIFDTSEKLTQEAVDKYNVKVIPKDTVILSFKLTVGRTGFTTEDMTTNEAIAHFDLNNKELNNYLYCTLTYFNYSDLGSTSSIATAINSKIVKSIKIGIPSDEQLNKFNNLTSAMFKTIKNNESENIKLSELRDTLLPKLMNGEIDLDNIEI